MIIDLHLGVNAEHTLSYKLYDNAVTELCHKRLNAQENKVVSRTQFDNFGEKTLILSFAKLMIHDS